MDVVASEGEAEDLAHDDQHRHRRLTIAPTEPIPCDEVYMEDINQDEDSDSISSTPTDSHITRDGGHGWTPVNLDKQVHFNSLSDLGGNRQLGRFWAQIDESGDKEDGILTHTGNELIIAASHEGFMIEDMNKTDDEIRAAEKVSFPSPSNSDFRCLISSKIIKAVTRDISLKHIMKPWSSPLPKPRISPPRTLGDVVIKNWCIRLRGGQMMPMLFKMSLPSMINASISSPKSIVTTSEWEATRMATIAKDPIAEVADGDIIARSKFKFWIGPEGVETQNAKPCKSYFGEKRFSMGVVLPFKRP
jgi:hypothetical protein